MSVDVIIVAIIIIVDVIVVVDISATVSRSRNPEGCSLQDRGSTHREQRPVLQCSDSRELSPAGSDIFLYASKALRTPDS